jgi:hypothetical protein
MVLPNPPFFEATICGNGIPVNSPKAIAANNKARNGCILSFVDERMINRIQIRRTIINSIGQFFTIPVLVI